MTVNAPGSGGNTGTANDLDGGDGPLGFRAPGGRKAPKKRPPRKEPRKPAPRKVAKKRKPARKARKTRR